MLTVAQQKTYHFIEQFFKKHNHSPTIAEIATGIGIKSRGVVHRYLQALANAEKIKILPGRHRNIQLLQSQDDQLLLIGKISNGKPIEEVKQKNCKDIAKTLIGKNRYILEVTDDSMIEEGIFAGDMLVYEQSEKVKNDEIVIALIDQQGAILRRVQYNKDTTITLKPANSRLLPIVYERDRVSIKGKLVGVIRLN